MNKQKGFTLVEMLVVIAVIGILSATALTALGPARTKAKDARIVSAMQQIRAIAEALYDGDYEAVTTGQSDIARAAAEITSNGGKDFDISLDADKQTYEAHATLNKGETYCVDSEGFAGVVTAATANGACVEPAAN